MEEQKLTPTQSRMLNILSDGLPHSREELHACLNDDLGELSNIQPHISLLRKSLRRHGQEIECVNRAGNWFYRHVRVLANS